MISTAARRRSAVSVGLVWARGLPEPTGDGPDTSGERMHLVGLYVFGLAPGRATVCLHGELAVDGLVSSAASELEAELAVDGLVVGGSC